jgi:cobalt transporter subunit CbtB
MPLGNREGAGPDDAPQARRPAIASHQPSVGGTEKEIATMNSSPASPVLTSGISARTWPALAAFVFGLVLFIGAGFAAPAVLHNATHDTRHALGLPCH